MDVFMKNAQPKTFRITFAGPTGTRKGEAFEKIAAGVPQDLQEGLDPFEIEGTNLISLVMKVSAIMADEPERDVLRLITTTGPIANNTCLNRLTDRADGLLFFVSTNLQKLDRAWEPIDGAFKSRNRLLADTPKLMVVSKADEANADLQKWMAAHGGEVLVVDPADEQWAMKALRQIVEKVLAGQEVAVAATDLFMPSDDSLGREKKRGLIGRLFGR